MVWVKRKKPELIKCASGLSYDFTECEYINVEVDIDFFKLAGYTTLTSETNPNETTTTAHDPPGLEAIGTEDTPDEVPSVSKPRRAYRRRGEQ